VTHHVTSEHQHLNLSTVDYQGHDQIRVGDVIGLPITHISSALLTLTRRQYILTQLLHIPLICKNLLSIHKFARENNVFFEYHFTYFLIKDCSSGITLHHNPLKDGLYQLHPSSTLSINNQALCTSTNHWQKRLGHLALCTVQRVLYMFQLPVIPNKVASPCTTCPQAKGYQLSFPVSTYRICTPVDLIYSDVWGPSPYTYFQSIGIIHCLSCPHTHQQQRCAERKHRHLINTTLVLQAESTLPKTFWDEACLTSCYLINRLSTPVLKNKSPFQTLFNRTLDYTFQKKFGCACFPNLRLYNSHKFSLRSKECI